MSAKFDRTLFPIASLLLGATLWGVVWYPLRLLEAQGLAGVWLTLILYAAALAAALPWTFRSLGEFRRYPRDLAFLMVTAGWTNIAFVEAVLMGNILRVLLLFYLAPLWQVLLGWMVLGERPSRPALVSLLFAMSGAVFMLWNRELGFPLPSGAADWFALSSGFAFATSNVMTRKIKSSLEAKAMSVWGGVVLVAFALIPLSGVPVPEISIGTLFAAVSLGLVGILVMTLLVQYGVTHMPVHRSAVISLCELVAGAISQQMLTNEVVTVREWVGGAFIVLGAYLSARASSPRDY